MAASDRLHVFYAKLLDDPEAPEALQRRVHRHATGNNDRKLLARLASHPALLTEFDEQFADSDDAMLITAWMSRPGRPPEAIAARARGETRVTVLAAIAQVETLDRATFAQMADADHPRVATALLTNPATPSGELAAAAATLARHLTDKVTDGKLAMYNLDRKLTPIKVAVAAAPEVGPAIITATDVPALLHAGAESPFLSADTAALACQKALDFQPPATENNMWQYQLPGHQKQVIIAALSGPGRDERVEASARSLRAELNREKRTAHLAGEISTALNGPGMSSTVRTRIDKASRFEHLDETQRTLLVDEVAATGPDSLVRLLVTSPAATPEQTYHLARSKTQGQRSIPRLGFGSIETVLASRRSDPAAFGAILAAHPSYVRDKVMARCVDPSAALLSAIRIAGASGDPLHRNMLESPLLTVQMLLEAPAAVLSQDLPATTRKLVTQLIAATLADESSWQTFEGLLANDFDGSVRMLLEVCEALIDQVA